MPNATQSLLFVVILAACSCSRSRSPAPPPAQIDCKDLFAPPPRGEKLCEEHVAATDSEIAWTSWALDEPLADVTRRYQDAAGRCHATTTPAPDFSVAQGERRISTHDATATGYPTCEKKPSPVHK